MAQRLLSETDLAFVRESVQPPVPEESALRWMLAEDEAFRSAVLGGDSLFNRVIALDEALVRVSPRLFFEVLLRRSIQELGHGAHVLERAGTQRVPVFVNDRAVRVVAEPAVLDYLAQMLASFTRVESHTSRVRVRRGVWRKARYSDLDVASLLRLAHQVEETERMAVYRRAADASLLILGMFPDFPATATRYPGTGALRARRARLSTEEYETIAARAYGLASQDSAAADAGLTEPMRTLSEHVLEAKVPLNHLAEHHLRFTRSAPFGHVGSPSVE